MKSRKKEQKLKALEQAACNDVQRTWLRDYDWTSMERRVARRIAELLPDGPEHPTAEERQRLGYLERFCLPRCFHHLVIHGL